MKLRSLAVVAVAATVLTGAAVAAAAVTIPAATKKAPASADAQAAVNEPAAAAAPEAADAPAPAASAARAPAAAAGEVLYDTVAPATSYRAPQKGAAFAVYPLAAVTINVVAGQRTYVSGVLAFSSTNLGSIVDASVQCGNGPRNAGKVVHGENVGTNYQRSTTITARLLATSTARGTLVCRLYAYAHSLGTPATRFSITSGHLEVGRRSVPNGVQVVSGQQLAKAGHAVWTPRVTGNASVRGVSNLWRLPAGTKNLNVFADQSITVCKTSGDGKYGCPGGTRGSSAAVRTTLIATQFTSTGAVCQTRTYPVSRTVSTALHHVVFYHNIPNVAVRTTGGCVPVFSIYLKTEVRSGQAVVTNKAAPTGEMGVLFVLPS
ncbi:hypothetical protein [Fodinicola acaciae]|uniref:hypothetical protein n=1 Tax=Fodinicola acaciae TaxID=2681555 RepID=UPI0013D1A063|nr:hypothetical protein [Fodinicola acaciae]